MRERVRNRNGCATMPRSDAEPRPQGERPVVQNVSVYRYLLMVSLALGAAAACVPWGAGDPGIVW